MGSIAAGPPARTTVPQMPASPASSPTGLPVHSPKAQLSCCIVIEIRASAGTLTATGTKARPQVEPGKSALASSVPASRSRIVKVGDLPTGSQTLYSSPAAPK